MEVKPVAVRGPIDYVIVGFEGNKFDGSILSALADAIDNGIIGLVDLSVISKTEQGDVIAADVANLGDTVAVDFVKKYHNGPKSIEQDDIDEMAELLENNTSAALLVVEQLWAKPLKEAIIKANGTLVAEGRIHPDAAEELNK